jgi:hypothetical protein
MNFHLLSFILAILFAVPCANAAQAIYKTVGHETLIGDGRIFKVVTKGFMVLDIDSTNQSTNVTATAIGGFTLNGQKYFTVVPLQNHRLVRVTGPNGDIYDVIAKAESPGTQFAGTILESVYYQGKESPVTILPSGPINLPKTTFGKEQEITRNDASGITLAGTGTETATLDVKGSLESNTNGESFDSVVTRLAAIFIQAGYTQVTAPAAP